MKKLLLIIIVLVTILLTACEAAPEGRYIVYPADGQAVTPVTAESNGYILDLRPAPPTYTLYPTYTPGDVIVPTQESTALPTIDPGGNKCELRILNYNHNIRADHLPNATILANIERLQWADGISFWYSSQNVEWAEVSWQNNNTGGPTYTGWIEVTDNVEYDPLGPCIDLPTEYEANPVPTNAPTATPAPEETECEAQALSNVNVRDVPAGNWITTIQALETIYPIARYQYPNSYLYYKIWLSEQQVYAWTADFYQEQNSACGELPFVDPFESTEVQSVMAGFHILFNNDTTEVLNNADKQQIAKCLDWTWNVCNQLKQRNPDIKLVARTLQTNYGQIDCPSDWMYESPMIWWDAIRNHLPDGYDYYEIQNECPPPAQGWEKWASWSIEMAKLVEKDKGGALLAFSFPPGNPDYPYWPALEEYFRWAADNPLPNGTHHGIAFHASPFAPWNRPDMPWVNNPHLAGRHQIVRDVLLANTGIDLKNWAGTIIVTEIGLSDGYSGNWNAPYSCEEMTDTYIATLEEYKNEGYIDGFTWWNVGKIGKWTDDSMCLPNLFRENFVNSVKSIANALLRY